MAVCNFCLSACWCEVVAVSVCLLVCLSAVCLLVWKIFCVCLMFAVHLSAGVEELQCLSTLLSVCLLV